MTGQFDITGWATVAAVIIAIVGVFYTRKQDHRQQLQYERERNAIREQEIGERSRMHQENINRFNSLEVFVAQQREINLKRDEQIGLLREQLIEMKQQGKDLARRTEWLENNLWKKMNGG